MKLSQVKKGMEVRMIGGSVIYKVESIAGPLAVASLPSTITMFSAGGKKRVNIFAHQLQNTCECGYIHENNECPNCGEAAE